MFPNLPSQSHGLRMGVHMAWFKDILDWFQTLEDNSFQRPKFFDHELLVTQKLKKNKYKNIGTKCFGFKKFVGQTKILVEKMLVRFC